MDIAGRNIDRSRFSEAIELYRDWNSRINVISRKDMDLVYEHHFLHSLAIARYMQLHYGDDVPEGAEVLDVGTGGGFPGIPLAMVYPELKFTLCDSVGKKTMVAREVARSLGLDNVTVVNSRVEALPGTYDWIVSRAVSSFENLYPWVKGKYSRGILCLKGGDIAPEIDILTDKFHVSPSSIRCWGIDSWLKDEYFAEKFVIEIGKNYLCTPNSDKYKKTR